MTKEERELSIMYLEEMKENYTEGEGYERHPLPEYYAIEMAIKSLKQEPVLDKIRSEIMQLDCDVDTVDYDYNDLVQTEEVHMICREEVLQIIDEYEAEREDNEADLNFDEEENEK